MYKFLLFDIDGTLLNFEASERSAVKHLFEKYELGECTDQMVEAYSRINVKYWEALERGEMTKPQILVERFVEFFESIGVDASIAKAFNDDYQLTLGDYCVLVDGAMEILEEYKGKAKLIAVTNGTKIAQTKKLKESGLGKMFDLIFISEDVGFEKPRREFFNRVFEQALIADKQTAVIIGDSLTSDIKGGEIMGIDTVWFNPKHAKNDKGVRVSYEIDSLQELRSIL